MSNSFGSDRHRSSGWLHSPREHRIEEERQQRESTRPLSFTSPLHVTSPLSVTRPLNVTRALSMGIVDENNRNESEPDKNITETEEKSDVAKRQQPRTVTTSLQGFFQGLNGSSKESL